MGSANPVSRYASLSDLCAEFGIPAIQAWSDTDGIGRRDDRRVQEAFDKADAEIIGAFIGVGNYSIPLSPAGFDEATVRRWVVELAGCWLYFNRGQTDDGPENDRYAKMRETVRGEIALAKMNGGQLIGTRRSLVDPSTGQPQIMRLSGDDNEKCW